MTKLDTIRFLNREDIDILKYDKLIEMNKSISIYCYSWYLDAVSDCWGVLVKGDYETVLPIIYTVKFGQKIIYQPFFTREITLFSKSNESDISLFLNKIPKLFKKIDFGYHLKINSSEYSEVAVMNQELDLEGSYEKKYKQYSTNTRRLIKKAIKANCVIKESDDVESFISFFKLHTGERVNYSDYNYENLNRLIAVLLARKKGRVFHVLIDGVIVAQGVYLIQNHRITYLKGTTNVFGKKIGAMFLLMDYLIKQYVEQSLVFDFGGSKIDSIATFYKKFGAKDRFYYMYSKNEQSWILKKGKKLRDLLKN